MSSVFLADVDDYLSPSTACVNPAFSSAAGSTRGVEQQDDPSAGAAATTTVVTVTDPRANRNDDERSGGSLGVTAADYGGGGGVVGRIHRSRGVRRGRGQGRGQTSTSNGSNGSSVGNDTPAGGSKVTASIVDCLACSGCVTTAETVLLKEHSVDKFREMVVRARRSRRKRTSAGDRIGDTAYRMEIDDELEEEEEEDDDDDDSDRAVVVVTLSAASAAELLRLLRQRPGGRGGEDEDVAVGSESGLSKATMGLGPQEPLLLLHHRKLVALLCRQLRVDAVIDGKLALEWSLRQAALEFCERYRHQQQHHQNHHQQPQLSNSDAAATVSTVVSSSCPATVCYVEKTCHSAVPHLSRVMSPMGCARVYLSSQPQIRSNKDNEDNERRKSTAVRHVAIMPCHDKKLEATRPTNTAGADDDDGGDVNNQSVLVLTTSDCWQLLLESIAAEDDDDPAPRRNADEDVPLPSREQRLRRLFEALAPSAVDRVPSAQGFEPRRQGIVRNSYITTEADNGIEGGGGGGAHSLDTPSPSLLSSSSPPPPPPRLLHTSGGYADYIFRFAARRLFGEHLTQVEWKPVSALALASPAASGQAVAASHRAQPAAAEGRPTVTASARVASARREILEATLYRQEYRRLSSTGLSQSSSASPPPGESTVVEYSCQEQPAASASLVLVSTTPVLRFAMAHGLQVMQRVIHSAGSEAGGRYHYVEAMACPSGCLNGGGQVLPASSRDGRREPPSEVKARVEAASRNLRVPTFQQLAAAPCPQEHRSTANEMLQTTFHAVQPLQLQYGAAKGLAVKDIQW